MLRARKALRTWTGFLFVCVSIESFYENMDKYITHQDYIKFNLIFEVFEFETENKLVIFTEII